MGVKEDAVGRRDIYEIPPDKIEVQEGFNLRTDFGEDFGEFCADIAANKVREPITVHRTKEGRYFVRNGHRRLMAAQKAGLESIPCMLEEKSLSDIEVIFACLSGNNAKPFTDAEKGEGFRRLLGFGCKLPDLAKRTGHTVAFIKGCLALAASPEMREAGMSAAAAAELSKVPTAKAKEIVASGARSASEVRQMVNGAKAKAPRPKFLQHEYGRFTHAGRQRELTDLERGYLRGICVALGTERPLEMEEA
jgi:ParB/RepB/Spo0J family partition protein